MKYTFKIPTMSCQHCKMRIAKALSPYASPANVAFDLSSKKVVVETDTPLTILIEAIESVGYPVEHDN
ncbi:MAG TPA: heavy-metal-associated domain-containing protein [Candidatus Marinimicrobia bacterium]|mgnify:FL=1|nr:heavy-metal-associated domain-containing protein [Candidatus Neomarinimicrobiota bacterium]HRS91316.1 heavy-metal-associated domain-containing protein [Candidatus Neomarinimicrobiota bacterium]